VSKTIRKVNIFRKVDSAWDGVMATLTADESLKENIAAMGKDLGEQYSELWQEAAYLHAKWAEYVELFGTKESRIDLLNGAAGHLFAMIQDQMWDDILMHIARLTDPPATGKKRNLTLRNLPDLVTDDLKPPVKACIDEVLGYTEFCRDWRNRRVAHTDLLLALNASPELLKEGSRKDIVKALAAIVKNLSTVSEAYTGAETGLDALSPPGGAIDLLRVIHDGLVAQGQREQRWESGKQTPEDELHPDI
jgi:hypothetical protein